MLFCFLLLSATGFAAKSPDLSVAGWVRSNKDFGTLANALKGSGLLADLDGAGPFTLFAPTDEAFARIEPKALDALVKNKRELLRVLRYHVVPGKILAKDAFALAAGNKEIRTLEGTDATLRAEGNALFVDYARVLKPDLPATNGVVHVLDSVLMPKPK